MSDYIGIAAAALLGILVPSCAGWLWNRVKAELQAGNKTLMQKIEEIQAEQKSMRDEHALMRAVQRTHGEDISFLKGADSQRQATATAALEAARLLLHPDLATMQIPHPDTEKG